MRITEIEIKNFRSFYGSYLIDLQKAGKNVLVYGENGKRPPTGIRRHIDF